MALLSFGRWRGEGSESLPPGMRLRLVLLMALLLTEGYVPTKVCSWGQLVEGRSVWVLWVLGSKYTRLFVTGDDRINCRKASQQAKPVRVTVLTGIKCLQEA